MNLNKENKEPEYHEIRTDGNLGLKINEWKKRNKNIIITNMFYSTIATGSNGPNKIWSSVLIEYIKAD